MNPFLLTLSLLLFSLQSYADECTSAWREVDWKIVPFIDTNARYLSYQFKIPKGEAIKIKMEGEIPTARYFSYHVYDQLTENALSAILDSDIASQNGKYTVWAVPQEDLPSVENTIALPSTSEREQLIDIWFRVYVNEGELKYPKISVFNAKTDLPSKCPPLHQKIFSIATEPGPYGIRLPSKYVERKVPLPFKSGDIHFFAPDSGSLGANLHNEYMSTRLDGKGLFPANTMKGRVERRKLRQEGAIQDIGDVAVIHFRMPPPDQLRYWSVCLSGADTSTSDCILDSKALLKFDRFGEPFVWIIVGPNRKDLKAGAAKLGFNYLDHSTHRIPILFYRQMLANPEFEGNIQKVAKIPASQLSEMKAKPYFSEKYIDAYAPVGRACWFDKHFLETLCR